MTVDDLQRFENLHLSSEEEMADHAGNFNALSQWSTSWESAVPTAIVFGLEPHDNEEWHSSDLTLASYGGLSTQFIEETPSTPFGNHISMEDSLDSELHSSSEIPRSPEGIIPTQSKGHGPGQHVFAISMPKR
jgi:hypothetical protein